MAREILIVDDETDIRMLVAGILQDEGYKIREAADARTALEEVRKRLPGLVILDIWLEGSDLDGVEVLKQIKASYPQLPVVMMSGHGTIETAVGSIRDGAFDFVEKPFKVDRMLHIVKRAIENSELRRENKILKEKLPENKSLIGQSPTIQALRNAIEKVAPTGSRVLITGPAGAGKEVAARQLHDLSTRSEGPLTIVNCASMHPERMEAELFGEERRQEARGDMLVRPGLLEQSHGGTLLLDEVADMPIETQGKIVRVLQEQSFQRLGGQTAVEVDVRVIASTNKDLFALIKEGLFREDLLYRLNVVPLSLPALKDRKDDLEDLTRVFMELSSQSNGLLPRRLSADAMMMLKSYDWPGNVRQLRNVIEWLLIMAPGDQGTEITAEMLPSNISGAAPFIDLSVDQDNLTMLSLRKARESFEKRYLETQVNRFGGNVSKTAEFVGMERSALHRKLKSLGILTDRNS